MPNATSKSKSQHTEDKIFKNILMVVLVENLVPVDIVEVVGMIVGMCYLQEYWILSCTLEICMTMAAKK